MLCCTCRQAELGKTCAVYYWGETSAINMASGGNNDIKRNCHGDPKQLLELLTSDAAQIS